MNQYSKVHKKPWKNDQDLYKCHLTSWKDKKLSSIHKSDVTSMHIKIGRHSRYSANRTLSLLHTMYNKAIEWGYDRVNPCSGIKKFKEKSRKRFFQSDELPRFLKLLTMNQRNYLKTIFTLLYSQGQDEEL